MKKIQLFTLLIFVSTLSYATIEIDSLVCAFIENTQTKKNQELLKAYEDLLEVLYDKEAFRDLIEHSRKAAIVAEQYKDKAYLSKFIYMEGFSFERMGSYAKALSAFDRIIDLADKGAEKKTIMKTLSQISIIYQQSGNFEKAYDYQMRALQGFEEMNEVSGICRSNYSIGTIFYYQKQYEKALEQYQKSLKLAEQTNLPRLIYSSLGALGATYGELGNQKECLRYNNKSLVLAKKINYDSGIAYTLNNLGVFYLKVGDCNSAQKAILESIEIKEKINDRWGLMGSLFAMVRVNDQCSSGEKVLGFLQNALKMSKEIESKSGELEAYERLIKFYDERNPVVAYDYTKKFIALKDTVLSEKTFEEMGQSRQRYQLAKKEHEISLLKAENKILYINNENQRLCKLLYVVFIGLLLFITFWFFSRIKMQGRINQMLEGKNDLLNQKNEEIRIKNKQLEHSNEDLAQFAYVASHDLTEPLRMIHSYTTLLKRRYNDQLDDSGKEFMHYIVDAVDRMKSLLDDLLDYSRSGKQKLPDTLVSTEDTMVVVTANLSKQIENIKGRLIVRNENLPAILAHKSQLMQLLQNLVSNGLKFCGERDPVIIVDCKQKKDLFVFSVKDNGIGISPANQEKVFEMFRRLHTREEYAGTGIGLAICKKIVSNMGGNIWVESKQGEGSTFFFTVPCPSGVLVPAE